MLASCYLVASSEYKYVGERLGDGRVEGESAGFIDIETIDQSGQHRHDTPEHLLTWVDTVNRDKALRHGSIETGSALDGRATRVVEKLGPLTAATLSVSFDRYSEVPKGLRGRVAQTTPVGDEPETERGLRKSQ